MVGREVCETVRWPWCCRLRARGCWLVAVRWFVARIVRIAGRAIANEHRWKTVQVPLDRIHESHFAERFARKSLGRVGA
jgi:hypothetical protein